MTTWLIIGGSVVATIIAGIAAWALIDRAHEHGHGLWQPAGRHVVSVPAQEDRTYSSALEPLPPNLAERNWTPRPISPARDLAPWVAKALANAKPDETVIDTNHATVPRWLENVVGGDPYDGCGSSDGYVERLFAGLRPGVA